MNAEILAVGTELLLGDIVNTNAQYLARRFSDLGINVYHQTVVGDNEKRLLDAFGLAFSRANIVITTGGLGPTKDDLTKEIGASFFNKKLILDDKALKRIIKFFSLRSVPVNEGNRKQAYVPENCIVLQNDNGTAPGCIVEEQHKILIMLPGPPKEMVPMFEKDVVPFLKKFNNGVLVSKVLRVIGIGEGHMAEKIGDIIETQTNPTVAPYAKDGEVTVRITARADDQGAASVLIEKTETEIRNRLLDDVYGVDDDTLEGVIGRLLIEKELTISTAESCTGGLLAGRLINYSGISSVFIDGVVSYSNESKMKRLEVSPATLQKYGAVSEEVAGEMAAGIAKTSGTKIGVSTTGVAGPTGGSEAKPVGLVYVGLYIDGKIKVRKLNLWGDRRKIRERAVNEALDFLRREVIIYR